MKLIEIKNIIEEFSNTDLSIESRKTQHKVPRFIYYTLARKYTNSTFDAIGISVKRTHSAVLNGVKKYKAELKANPKYQRLSNDCEEFILKHSTKEDVPTIRLLRNKFYNKKNEQQTKEINKLQGLTTIQNNVFNELLKLNDKELLELNETRFKPFISMLKTRVLPKPKTIVQPARMKRFSKIY